MTIGALVALCGIDGSGKTTQAELLRRRAESEGLSVREMSFPRYGQGFFADLIERYLQGEFARNAADVSPYLASLPYACDRQQAAPQLRAWRQEGALVICNRYVPANMAHQGSKLPAGPQREAFLQWVQELEYDVFGIPRPDLHVLLDVPPRVSARLARARAQARGQAGAVDIHERDMDHLTSTAAVYRALAQADPARWVVVPCTDNDALLPPETIAETLWSAVRRVLYNRAEP
jgi:dTMP kinase